MKEIKVDYLILGAGIVGVHLAYALARQYPTKTIALAEKEKKIGQGVSSRNSGVIHASIYYRPDSHKARLCRRGNILTYQFCREIRIMHRPIGKLVVATSGNEAEQLEQLYANAQQMAAGEVNMLTKQEIREKGLGDRCIMAMHSKATGIVDVVEYLAGMLSLIKSMGVLVGFDNPLLAVESIENNRVVIRLGKESIVASQVINCCGLQAVDVAAMFGVSGYQLRPNKGEYYRITKEVSISELVYPVPNSVALGIHFTRNVYNELYAGPSNTWVDDSNDYRITQSAKPFAFAISRLFDGIKESDMQAGFAGIRPKVAKDGVLQDDFIFLFQQPNVLHLLGIESPGFTAAPAIGEYLAAKIP